MPSIYADIETLVRAIWTAGWTHPTVPAYWRPQEVGVLPDPGVVPYFMRNEITHGQERLAAFGGGRFANERLKYGSVIVRVFSDVNIPTDVVALGLLSDAEAVYRSARSGGISFIGGMSNYDANADGEPTLDSGNWATRGSLLVWQYRFTG